MNQPVRPRFTRTFAALAVGLGTMFTAHAGDTGEALAIELPSMRTPVEAMTPELRSSAPVVSTSVDEVTPLTRADVRESLSRAQATNRVTPLGEIGDTPEVLAAREDFNELQAQVIHDEQVAEAERAVAALYAQELQARVSEPMTLSDLIAALEEGLEPGDTVIFYFAEPEGAEAE